MTFFEALQPYINKNGNVTLKPNWPVDEDNNHYFYAVAVDIGARLGIQIETMKWIWSRAQYIRACTALPGLYRRAPDNYTRLISQDEMIGIASLSYMHAHNIVAYGLRHWWCFNNLGDRGPTLSAWQGRFLSPIAYYCARAGYKLSLLQKLKVFAHLYYLSSLPAGETSGRCLMTLMLYAFGKESSWLIKKGIKRFKASSTALYGDLGGLYAIYYGPDHPFAIYTKGMAF